MQAQVCRAVPCRPVPALPTNAAIHVLLRQSEEVCALWSSFVLLQAQVQSNAAVWAHLSSRVSSWRLPSMLKIRLVSPCHCPWLPRCVCLTTVVRTHAGTHKCQCARYSKMVACSGAVWQCGEVCGASLGCGKHTCQRVCHVGKCGPCSGTLPRRYTASHVMSQQAATHRRMYFVLRCPCGRTEAVVDCSLPTPTCGAICDKELACGRHKCFDACHTGDCSECTQVRDFVG